MSKTAVNIVQELETVAESFHHDGTAPYTMDLLLRARHEIIELRRNRRGERLERMKLLRTYGQDVGK